MTSDAALLEADAGARSRALTPDGSFIVQAPAGSGKTELLIQRYLGLLATVERPEEVLAITFTRKAALEMKGRVLDALRRARDGYSPQSAHESLTQSLAFAALERAADRDWDIIESPARMRIETVDAFSAGIARAIPLGSGLGGIQRTVADDEIVTVYRAAAIATLDHLAADGPTGDAVGRVLRHLDNNSGLYISYIARMLSSREQWLGITGGGGLRGAQAAAARTRLERNIADVISRQLSLLDALMPPVCRNELPALLSYAAGNLLETGRQEHRLAEFAGVRSLPSTDAEDRNRWHAIADLLLTKKGEWRKQSTKNDGFPAEGKPEKQALAAIIESLHGLHDLREQLDLARSLPDPHYTDEQWAVLLALFDLLPLAVSELQRLFAERGVTDHTEVALSAGRALGEADAPTDMALILDYRIRHLLVDEMQDTSIAQYELLKKLTAGWTPDDGRTIFCVGDPMQSIYRFRDAEVGEFLLARERGIGGVPLESLTLRRNFRSGEHLVHWFNTVFSQVMPLTDNVAAGAIRYAESVPVDAHAGQGHFQVYPLFDASAEEEADVTLDVIRQLLDETGDEEIAVLVRSRTQLPALLGALRRAKVAYEAVEIDRLTDLPEVIDLLALTRALCHRGDRLAWLALLRGPYAGLRWDDILSLVVNDHDSTAWQLMHDEERLSRLSQDGRERLLRLRDALQPFLVPAQTGSLGERIEKAWFSLGGPVPLETDQVDNVYRYLDALERLAVGGTLADVVDLERRLDGERVSGSPGRSRLKIMTMHKAKGLQFEHVILPSLGRMTRGVSREVLSWLNLPDAVGESEMILSPVGARAELENDPLHQFIEATEKEKDRLELDRLLYVACTRAMKSLHLIGSVGVSADGESCRQPDPRSLLMRLWPAVEREYRAAFDAWLASGAGEAIGPGRDEEAHLVSPPLKRLRDPWAPPETTRLPVKIGDVEGDGEPHEVEFYWVGATARHAGTIVHRWLERLGGDGGGDRARVQDLMPATRRWALELGVPQAEIEPVCERALAAVARVLDDERGRWILRGDGAKELPLTGLHAGRVQSVVIDRVRIDEDGTHWIIDYKTSTHEGGDLEGFLEQESDRYREQLSRYAGMYEDLTGESVRTALYFPLLGEFVEVQRDRS